MGAQWPHGRIGEYDRGCTCAPCRRANNQRVARQKSTRQRHRDQTSRVFNHGLSGYDNYDCRCKVCRAAAAAKYRQLQQETLNAATSRYKPWTQDELEVARDRSLTAANAALRLGRTFSSVKSVRTRRYEHPE